MSWLVDLKQKVFHDLYIIEQAKSSGDHAKWKVYCDRCHRYDESSTGVLFNRKHTRCSRCHKTRFEYKTSKEIVEYLEKGYTITELCSDYDCSDTAIYSAIKLFANSEEFLERDLTYERVVRL